jgi:hypothetical protein
MIKINRNSTLKYGLRKKNQKREKKSNAIKKSHGFVVKKPRCMDLRQSYVYGIICFFF